MIMPSEPEMWAALANRNPAFDGQFLYGVLTTGVYCRPSCAARPARKENVRFYADAEAAVAAGLRPCKRCRPDEESPTKAMAALAAYIDAHADETLSLGHLAARAGLSPGRLQKVFKATLGVSPKGYQDGRRLARLKGALRDGDAIAGAIYEAGYGSTSRVDGEAARNLGMTPKAYRAGGAGETIAYAFRQSALGGLMMGATDRGICFAQFGDSETALRMALAAEFPSAIRQPSDTQTAPELDIWMAALEAHISEGLPRPDLPLDIRGTAFQIRVWRFLLSVREGEVISYGELAASIDAPKAVRAAASACAANRIAVLIPCHRVLRGDGSLGGYRWGLERKRALLDGERKRRGSAP